MVAPEKCKGMTTFPRGQKRDVNIDPVFFENKSWFFRVSWVLTISCIERRRNAEVEPHFHGISTGREKWWHPSKENVNREPNFQRGDINRSGSQLDAD